MRVPTGGGAVPKPVTLYDGGVVMSLPASSTSVYAARARADALLVKLVDGEVAVTKAGGVVTGVPDLTDPVERQGVWDALFALSLAEMLITGWEGIEDDDKAPLPYAPANVIHLMSDPRAADLYIGQIMAPHREREAGGNV